MGEFHWYSQLRDPADLLRALRHELRKMQEDPSSPYHAYSFFVAADTLLYWSYPGHENKEKRDHVLKKNPFLRLCSQVAGGLKVLERSGAESDGTQATAGGLYVRLHPEEEAEFDTTGNVGELAQRVLDFWETHRTP